MSVGELENTKAPAVPVSSSMSAASSEEASISVSRRRFTEPARVSISPTVSISVETMTFVPPRMLSSLVIESIEVVPRAVELRVVPERPI